jgi:hypothetical protein
MVLDQQGVLTIRFLALFLFTVLYYRIQIGYHQQTGSCLWRVERMFLSLGVGERLEQTFLM